MNKAVICFIPIIKEQSGGPLGKVDKPGGHITRRVYYLVADEGIARSFGAGGRFSGLNVGQIACLMARVE